MTRLPTRSGPAGSWDPVTFLLYRPRRIYHTGHSVRSHKQLTFNALLGSNFPGLASGAKSKKEQTLWRKNRKKDLSPRSGQEAERAFSVAF